MKSSPLLLSTVTVALIGITSWQQDARACSAGPEPHELDPAEQELDHQAPGVPTVLSAEVLRRGTGPNCNGSGFDSTSIDGLGSIGIEVQAPADDRTPAEQMGYRIDHLDGDLPEGLLPDYDVRPRDGQIVLGWGDGDKDDQESLDFRLVIRAVDLGGNVGPPSAPIEIRHPGSGGCASSPPSPVWVVLLVLFGLRRSRG